MVAKIGVEVIILSIRSDLEGKKSDGTLTSAAIARTESIWMSVSSIIWGVL